MSNEIHFQNGFFIDAEGSSSEIGEVKVSLEYCDGVIRLCDVVIYDTNDCELFNDNNLINNEEFYSEQDILNSLSARYNVSSKQIEFV